MDELLVQYGDKDDQIWESSALLAENLTRPKLMPGIMTANDKIMLVAQPKVGKSILVQQLASALCGGHPFLGFTPISGQHRVLYIAAEGDLDELQERGRCMGKLLPVPAGRLYYWPVPTQPLNTQAGYAKLMEFGMQIKPALTIFDPIFALMKGSMTNDENMMALMRAVNRYQYEIGSAVMFVHHDHRAKRDLEGKVMQEGDDSYFGSFVIKAWPRALWTMKAPDKQDPRKVILACETQRNRECKIGSGKDARKLILAEPDPLIFIEEVAGVSVTGHSVLAALTATESATQAELALQLGKSDSVVSEALSALGHRVTAEANSWPVEYRVSGTSKGY